MPEPAQPMPIGVSLEGALLGAVFGLVVALIYYGSDFTYRRTLRAFKK